MELTKKVLITIGRDFGSGGRETAETLGKELNIPVFNKNMLGIIAKKHGYDEATLLGEDEKLTNPFFEPYPSYGMESGSLAERLFVMQSKIIREEADKGSAIFVGRCANHVLRKYPDTVNIFLYAPKEDRVARVMKLEGFQEQEAAEKAVKRIDKQRRSYYQFYTDNKWGTTDGMDLLIDSSRVGIQNCPALIEAYLKVRGYLKD